MKAAFLLALLTAIMTSDTTGQSAGGGRLAGAWDTSVTIYNCSTGAPIREFQSVGTLHQGGTFSGISSGMPPTLRSSELGVWKHVKSNKYTLRFKAYLFDGAGNATSYQVITHLIDLSQDDLSYTSNGGVQIFNMAGTQVGSGCSSAVASRISLD